MEKKTTLIRNYSNLKEKYLQQRDLSDCLLQPIVGSADWRNHLSFEEQTGKYKPAFCTVFPKSLPDIPVKLFDWSWNHIDTTQFLGWSVFHVGWEWLMPPDENGFGAFNVGWQDAPGRGGKLEAAFASWDNPMPYISFPLEHEYAMLIRFWRYDASEQQFKLPGEAILIEWDEAKEGGTNTWTKILDLNGQDCDKFEEGDHSAMPHEQEEIGSWTMAFLEMARRKGFDVSSYTPQWKVSGAKTKLSESDSDPGNVKLFSEADLEEMDTVNLQRAYDALWQKYLGVKIKADYALHYYGDNPDYVRPNCSEIYNKNFIPK